MVGDSSLNVSVSDAEDDSSERMDFIVDKSQNVEEKISSKQEIQFKKRILYSCLQKLNEREQEIIKSRMLSEKEITLEELGTKFNISRERVRQIEKKAFEKLSNFVKEEMKKYKD